MKKILSAFVFYLLYFLIVTTATPPTIARMFKPTATPVLAITPADQASEIVVNTTDDVDDGVCDSFHCSLREAINAANERAGPDLIVFDPTVFPLSGSGVIKPATELPFILDGETTIDATGAKVKLDGSELTSFGILANCFVIYNSSGNVLRGMEIQNFPGMSIIFISAHNGGKANNNTLMGLRMSDNGFGLPPFNGRGDAVSITTNGGGIMACGNRVIDCTIEDNADDGIVIEARDGGSCDSNFVIGNILKSNAENGIEIDSEDAGSSASGNTIANNTIEDHQYHNSFFLESYNGAKTNNNIICSNTISSGGFDGIEMSSVDKGSRSIGNLIINNQISDHVNNGITIVNYSGGSAVNNIIKGNTCQDNGGVGMNIATNGNRLYHNNVIGNYKNGQDGGKNNRWDYKGNGNYWSDYNGQDSNGDGIGDVPYSIYPNGQDRYPLMTKFMPKKPKSPKKLRAKVLSGEKIKLKWAYSSKDIYGFVIHRKEKLGKKWEWIPIEWTKDKTKTYTDTGLIPNTLYRYRVQAYNARGYSGFSKIKKARTEKN